MTLSNGRCVPVEHSVHPRARRMTLKVDPVREVAVITTPKRVSAKDALAFARNHTTFVEHRLKELPPWRAFLPGDPLPLGDALVTIRHAPDARRGVWLDGDDVFVSGEEAFVPRRVADWLRREARRRFTPLLTGFADTLEVKRPAVRIGDPRSRWGSCSGTGTVSLSWRLIAAPEAVQTYVIAHEAAHLREPNHSTRFWRVVTDLVGPHEPEKQWLKENGVALHRMGPRR